MIILDTCGLLWLVAGDPRLTQGTRARLDSEAIVSISAMSAFEIGVKNSSGKLTLPTPPREWWERAVLHHRLNVISPDAPTLIRSTQLPPLHKDPVDRIIIATAIVLDAPVLTADSRFREYGVQTIL